ncbi:MAG TPA: hypothetical protein VH228_10465 [Nocardioides sp.]|nr:hypothetical protein [Nocardioides sp.]
MTVDVPTLLSPDSLRAVLPTGGTVAYRLPSLPVGGVRVLGDWNGDGVQTPGIFDDGQWQLWNQVQRVNNPPVTTTFGQPGDVPVTGDWNGDGITDLGVVRGAEWLLALGPVPAGGPPQVWRDLTFGDGNGEPVTGDWDGDGTDGIGTFREGNWTLANSVDAPTATTSAAYGAPGDLPVVGDWDGDGTDGIGAVRGSTWYLSNRAVAPKTVSRPTFAPRPGETPGAWQVRSAPDAASCPTARRSRAGRASWVAPSTVLGADVAGGVGATGRRVRDSLETAERYLLRSQYDAKWRATRGRPYLDLLDGPGTDELAIRLPAMSALTVAIGLTTGAYDATTIGRTRAGAVRYVDQLVRSIACSHVSVSPGGWGRGWETAHWAMLAGVAAWLVWDDLTPQTRTDVTSMVVDEADRLTSQAVPYWGLPDGTIVTPGDTKAEENAWNSSLLTFAAAMMPSSPRAAAWRAQGAELAVAAFATQSDDSSARTVNGVPLSSRLQGFNAYPNGTVENHQRIHPDYASAIQLLWSAADLDRLARQRVPQAMFHNAGLVYSAFSTVTYQAGAASPAGGTYTPPGGSVYLPGHSSIYYPQGDDWGTARRAHFVSLDAHASVYAGYLDATGWPARRALAWHEKGQQELVQSSGTNDGRTYSVDPTVAAQQDTYPGREEYAAQNLATAWLALYIGQIGIPRLDRSTLSVPVATDRAPTAPTSRLLGP